MCGFIGLMCAIVAHGAIVRDGDKEEAKTYSVEEAKTYSAAADRAAEAEPWSKEYSPKLVEYALLESRKPKKPRPPEVTVSGLSPSAEQPAAPRGIKDSRNFATKGVDQCETKGPEECCEAAPLCTYCMGPTDQGCKVATNDTNARPDCNKCPKEAPGWSPPSDEEFAHLKDAEKKGYIGGLTRGKRRKPRNPKGLKIQLPGEE